MSGFMASGCAGVRLIGRRARGGTAPAASGRWPMGRTDQMEDSLWPWRSALADLSANYAV